MSWLTSLIKVIGRIVGIVDKAETVVSTVSTVAHQVEDLTSTQPSRQLSPEDIRRQRAQMSSATSFKVPPKPRR